MSQLYNARTKVSTLSPCAPELVIRQTPSNERSLIFFDKLREVDGDGYVLERPLDELRLAAGEGRLFQGQFKRLHSRTEDLACTTSMIRTDNFQGKLIGAISHVVVRRTQRHLGLAQFLAGTAIASRLIMDDEALTALIAITAANNSEAHRALLRARAITLTAEQAADIHPALGERYRVMTEIARQRMGSSEKVYLWAFTREAIRYLMALAYEASDPQGYDFVTEAGTTLHVRVEGDLAEAGAREVMRKMVYGEIVLPVEIVDFG